MLCSYAVKTKSKGMKSVLLLSAMRVLLGVTRGKRKPAIFKAYDFTKGGTSGAGTTGSVGAAPPPALLLRGKRGGRLVPFSY